MTCSTVLKNEICNHHLFLAWDPRHTTECRRHEPVQSNCIATHQNICLTSSWESTLHWRGEVSYFTSLYSPVQIFSKKGPAEAISEYLRNTSAAFTRWVGQKAFEKQSSSRWPATAKKDGEEKRDWSKQKSCTIHFPEQHRPVQCKSITLGPFQ